MCRLAAVGALQLEMTVGRSSSEQTGIHGQDLYSRKVGLSRLEKTTTRLGGLGDIYNLEKEMYSIRANPTRHLSRSRLQVIMAIPT